MAENVRISLWLPHELLAQLKASPAGVSEEIRRRVTESLARDSMDQRTRELEAAITMLAGLVEYDAGTAWHEHPATHAVFVQTILKLLAQTEPKTWSEAAHDLLGAGLTKKSDPATDRAEQLFRTYLAMKQAAPEPSRLAARHIRKKGDDNGEA